MHFEIVNHTHNYSRLLAYQLSSLILHPSRHMLTYNLFFDPQDKATVKVVEFFRPLMPANLTMKLFMTPVEMLRSRHVGRNIAAKQTLADWMWFTDTDYLFGPNIWEELADQVKGNGVPDFVWPNPIRETDWETGDMLIQQMNDLAVRDITQQQTYERRMSRAIGGVQIAKASVTKQTGYCPQYPQTPSERWWFRSDMSFRRQFPHRQSIKLTNCTRIRHSKRGYGQAEENEVFN